MKTNEIAQRLFLIKLNSQISVMRKWVTEWAEARERGDLHIPRRSNKDRATVDDAASRGVGG